MDLCGRIEFTAGWKKPCPPHPHGEGPVLQFSKGGVSHPLNQGLDDGQTQAGILPGTHLVRGIEALKDLIEASQEGLQRLPAGDVAGRPRPLPPLAACPPQTAIKQSKSPGP